MIARIKACTPIGSARANGSILIRVGVAKGHPNRKFDSMALRNMDSQQAV
jgi:hypothetical protein